MAQIGCCHTPHIWLHPCHFLPVWGGCTRPSLNRDVTFIFLNTAESRLGLLGLKRPRFRKDQEEASREGTGPSAAWREGPAWSLDPRWVHRGWSDSTPLWPALQVQLVDNWHPSILLSTPRAA